MEFASAEWLASLGAIILADLLLAGDNAIVIALAARNLPQKYRTRAIIFGTLGAIVARVILTFFLSTLLQINGVGVVGGALLYYIAWRLLIDDKGQDSDQKPASSFWEAIKIIIIADVVMALDNVLAIAGAARGDLTLIVIGLVISIPIVIAGSSLILKLLDRAKWLVLFGSGLLSAIAGRIILDDPWMQGNIQLSNTLEWTLILGVAGSVTALAWVAKNRASSQQQNN